MRLPLAPVGRNSITGLQTFQLVGDLHLHSSDYSWISTGRLAAITSDLSTGAVPVPVARWQAGDATDQDAVGDDALFLAWANALPADLDARVGFDAIPVGNHDVSAGALPQLRTGTAAMTAYGMPGINYTRQYGSLKLIVLGFETLDSIMSYPAATITFLDTELGNTTNDCVILCHAPLKNTVIKLDPSGIDSLSTGFWAASDAAFLAVLTAHSNAKVWLSGHTHSHPDDTNIVKTHSVGTRSIIAANAGSPYYTAPNVNPGDPLWTLWMTYDPANQLVSFRRRDHASGRWGLLMGQRVVTKAIPA